MAEHFIHVQMYIKEKNQNPIIIIIHHFYIYIFIYFQMDRSIMSMHVFYKGICNTDK